MAAKNKTIIFDSQTPATYILDLDLAPGQIIHLVLTTNTEIDTNVTSPGSQSNVTVELRGTSRCFRTLNVTNIRVIGDVTMNCSGVSTAANFVLNHATVDLTQGLIVTD